MTAEGVAGAGDPDATVSAVDQTNDPASRDPASTRRLPAPLQRRDRERYEVLGEHGRGGLGRVLLARDRELGRHVAIKEMLPSAAGAGSAAELRFFREAMITARLEHPGIVPVHEAGKWPDGVPFYAMKMVGGRSLGELVADATTLQERLALVPHVAAVADAVAYAHSRRIVHRDLKPSNVMVGEFGETIVIDWGIAKELDVAACDSISHRSGGATSGDLTMAGSVLGTPSFMAPEQAAGAPVDHRADIFSLGVMLNTLVRGRSTGGERINVPADLDAVIRKATAQDPEHRYSSASDLAADIRRYLTGKLVRARRYSMLDQVARAIAIRWKLALLSFASLLLITLVSLLAALLIYRKGAELAMSRNDLRSANVSLKRERDAQVLSTAAAQGVRDPSRALATLAEYTGDDFVLAAEIEATARQQGTAEVVVDAGAFSFISAHLTNGGDVVAASTARKLMTVSRGKAPRFLPDELAEDASFSVSTDGRVTVFTDRHGLTKARRDGRIVDILRTTGSPVVDISANGERLVVQDYEAMWTCQWGGAAYECAQRSRVARFDMADDGSEVAMCVGGRGEILSWRENVARMSWPCELGRNSDVKALGGTRTYLVSAAQNRLSLVRQEGVIDVSPHFDAEIMHVATSHDGRHIAAMDAIGNVRIWTAGGEVVWSKTVTTSGPRTRVTSLAVADGAASVAVGLETGDVRVIGAVSGTERLYRGHRKNVVLVAYDADGSLMSLSSDSLRIWPSSMEVSRTVLVVDDAFFHVLFVDKSRLLAETRKRKIHVLDLSTNPSSTPTAALPSQSFGLALSPNGERVAVAMWSGEIGILASDGRLIDSLKGHQGIVRAVEFVSDSELISCGADGRVLRWNLDGHSNVSLFEHADECYRIAVDRRRRTVAAGTYDGKLVVLPYDRPSEAMAHSISAVRVNAVLNDPDDGTFVATTNEGAVVKAHDRGVDVVMRRPHPAIVSTFSSRLGALVGWGDGAVYAVRDGAMIHPSTGSSVRALRQSPDGAFIAVADVAGGVAVLRVSDLARVRLDSHADTVSTAVFSEDSSVLVTAGLDGRVAITNLSSLAFVSGRQRPSARVFDMSAGIEKEQ